MMNTLTTTKYQKIVILDPDFRAREILRRLMECIPTVEVKGCFDRPWKVLKYAKAGEVNVIFVDLQLIKELEAPNIIYEFSKNTRIIVTSYFFDPLIDQIQPWIAGYLFKPVDPEELRELITK
jgi:DNA-binding NarL/FixJ family response regulator